MRGMTQATPPPPPPTTIPAGWYPQGDVQRYWDGAQWTEHTAPLATAPAATTAGAGQLLMQFASHIAGKNAQVQIYSDRVEWTKVGVLVGKKGSEVVPMRSISSVTTKRDGLRNTIVEVATSSGVIGMRVAHAQAEQVKRCLLGQILR